MASFGLKSKPKTKDVICPFCERSFQVAGRTMSLFCPHCRQRVIVEDRKIKSYHASRDFVTAGDVTVEKNGTLSAPSRVNSLVVKGKVWGNVRARQAIHIKKTGLLKGDITSPLLMVDEGGVLVGRCRIGT